MPWWLAIISAIGIPALKLVLRLLESRYPGIAPLVEAILKFLDGGGSVEALHSHCEALPGFCPSDIKKD